MNKKLFKWDFWTGVTALAIVIFGLFLIYPLFSLFASAFQNAETGGFSLERYPAFFAGNAARLYGRDDRKCRSVTSAIASR